MNYIFAKNISINEYKKCIFALICIIAVSFLFVGCGKEQDTDDKYEVIPFEAVTDINEDYDDIYVIGKAVNNNYWDGIKEAYTEIGKDQECNIYYSASDVEVHWKAQVDLMEQAIQNGADAIIIAPDDSSNLSGPIEDVYNSGIPVVLIDTTITSESYNVCYMTDNLLAGRNAAKEMLLQLKNMGNKEEDTLSVGIQIGSGISQTINERLAGFSQYWSVNAPENWKIIDDVKVNNGDIDYAITCGKEFFDEYDDIKGVFGCNNGSSVGFAKAIIEEERDDIVIVGFDYSDELANLIADEKYCASSIIQRQDKMVSMSLDAAMQLIKGHDIEEKFVDTNIIIVNKETIQTKEVQEVLE